VVRKADLFGLMMIVANYLRSLNPGTSALSMWLSTLRRLSQTVATAHDSGSSKSKVFSTNLKIARGCSHWLGLWVRTDSRSNTGLSKRTNTLDAGDDNLTGNALINS